MNPDGSDKQELATGLLSKQALRFVSGYATQ